MKNKIKTNKNELAKPASPIQERFLRLDSIEREHLAALEDIKRSLYNESGLGKERSRRDLDFILMSHVQSRRGDLSKETREAFVEEQTAKYLERGDIETATNLATQAECFSLAVRYLERVGQFEKAGEFAYKEGDYKRAIENFRHAKCFEIGFANAVFDEAKNFKVDNLSCKKAINIFIKKAEKETWMRSGMRAKEYVIPAYRLAKMIDDARLSEKLYKKIVKMLTVTDSFNYDAAGFISSEGGDLSEAAKHYVESGHIAEAFHVYVRMKEYETIVDLCNRQRISCEHIEKGGDILAQAGRKGEAKMCYDELLSHCLEYGKSKEAERVLKKIKSL